MNDQLQVYYYYTYSSRVGERSDGTTWVQNVPAWTHCFVHDGVHYARGTARCSQNDNPNKAHGRRIAYRRAMNAYYRQKTTTGQCPNGMQFIKSCAGHPLTELERKFLMHKKVIDTEPEVQVA